MRPFQHLNPNPGPRELRRFALAMLIGFFLLGLVAAWRHQHAGGLSWALGGRGMGLALGSLVAGLGRWVYVAVNGVSSLVGFVVSHVLLTAIFYRLFTPLAVALRLGGKDLLQRRRPRPAPSWLDRKKERGEDSYYRSF